MTAEEWAALGVQIYGLTADLLVPIAAADLTAIETCVGAIEHRLPGRKRPTSAVVVAARRPARNPRVPLWSEAESERYYERLHPPRQLWVHVDCANYRRAWERCGFGKLTSDVVLDHLQNRAYVRLSGYHHPFVRLCPMARQTNTSSGLDSGQEGMAKAVLQSRMAHPETMPEGMRTALSAPVILADPIDLTKMLDIPPGLSELQGAAAMLMKYYAVAPGNEPSSPTSAAGPGS